MRAVTHHTRLRAEAREAMARTQRARRDLETLGLVVGGLALVVAALAAANMLA